MVVPKKKVSVFSLKLNPGYLGYCYPENLEKLFKNKPSNIFKKSYL